MNKHYRGNYPEYNIFKEGNKKEGIKYVVRKFVDFDKSWAVYSKPVAQFEDESRAKSYIQTIMYVSINS